MGRSGARKRQSESDAMRKKRAESRAKDPSAQRRAAATAADIGYSPDYDARSVNNVAMAGFR